MLFICLLVVVLSVMCFILLCCFYLQLNVDREEFMLFQDAGFLEAEPGTLERTGKVTQKEVVANVATSVGEQVYKLDLELGPYHVDYTRNGNHMLLAGEKGHIAMMSTRGPQLITEFHVNETVRDACFLHNESLFAVSQRKSLYIYDRDGVELHCLRNHVEPTKLSFLPYHFLLAVASNTGYLKFQDISTGNLVSEHRTRLGACNVMAQNPHNGVMHCGHHNGLVRRFTVHNTHLQRFIVCV
jgi:U3 small nucleolar RNA-associated protein 7